MIRASARRTRALRNGRQPQKPGPKLPVGAAPASGPRATRGARRPRRSARRPRPPQAPAPIAAKAPPPPLAIVATMAPDELPRSRKNSEEAEAGRGVREEGRDGPGAVKEQREKLARKAAGGRAGGGRGGARKLKGTPCARRPPGPSERPVEAGRRQHAVVEVGPEVARHACRRAPSSFSSAQSRRQTRTARRPAVASASPDAGAHRTSAMSDECAGSTRRPHRRRNPTPLLYDRRTPTRRGAVRCQSRQRTLPSGPGSGGCVAARTSQTAIRPAKSPVQIAPSAARDAVNLGPVAVLLQFGARLDVPEPPRVVEASSRRAA